MLYKTVSAPLSISTLPVDIIAARDVIIVTNSTRPDNEILDHLSQAAVCFRDNRGNILIVDTPNDTQSTGNRVATLFAACSSIPIGAQIAKWIFAPAALGAACGPLVVILTTEVDTETLGSYFRKAMHWLTCKHFCKPSPSSLLPITSDPNTDFSDIVRAWEDKLSPHTQSGAGNQESRTVVMRPRSTSGPLITQTHKRKIMLGLSATGLILQLSVPNHLNLIISIIGLVLFVLNRLLYCFGERNPGPRWLPPR